MKSCNFIAPFISETQTTVLPEGVDWIQLTPAKDGTVCVQVRGEDAVIEAMKADPAYLYLEDAETVTDTKMYTEAATQIMDEGGTPIIIEGSLAVTASVARTFMTGKRSEAELNQLEWIDDKAIENMVRLHDRELAEYRNSGLGKDNA